MGTWFWLNIPLALLFVCCWAGIPLWFALTRWNAELDAKHSPARWITATMEHCCRSSGIDGASLRLNPVLQSHAVPTRRSKGARMLA